MYINSLFTVPGFKGSTCNTYLANNGIFLDCKFDTVGVINSSLKFHGSMDIDVSFFNT